ncbi:MAG: beta-lactamase family protein [Oscillospiraceae bacterium]|nr:beta-lactamase family protein [Oscillospiraceae bacterium]
MMKKKLIVCTVLCLTAVISATALAALWPNQKAEEYTEENVSDTASPSEILNTASPSEVSVAEIVPQKPEILPVEGQLAADLDGIFRKYKAANVSLAIIEDGTVTRHYEYGYKNISAKKPMTPNTKMRVASLSKVVSTMAAMTLYDKGELDLERDVGDYFGFRIRGKQADVPITTRMLMSHTSALADNMARMQRGDPLRVVARNSNSTVNPGVFRYANINIGLVGAEIEKITNKRFQDYAQEALFSPMGVDCGYDAANIRDTSDFANLYNAEKEVERTAETQAKPVKPRKIGEGYTTAYGSLLCSSTELAEILTILINGGEYNGQRILSRDTVELMETPVVAAKAGGVTFEQCLGLRRNHVFGRDVYYHNGNALGVISLLAYDKEHRCGVVVVTSGAGGGAKDGIYSVCYAAAARVFEDLQK